MSSPRSPSPLPQNLPAALSPLVTDGSAPGDGLKSPLRASIRSSSGSNGGGRSGGLKVRMESHPPRPTLDDKRAVAYDRTSARQSPYRSPPSGGMTRSGRLTGISSGGSSKDGQAARRRELSVPLVSYPSLVTTCRLTVPAITNIVALLARSDIADRRARVLEPSVSSRALIARRSRPHASLDIYHHAVSLQDAIFLVCTTTTSQSSVSRHGLTRPGTDLSRQPILERKATR